MSALVAEPNSLRLLPPVEHTRRVSLAQASCLLKRKQRPEAAFRAAARAYGLVAEGANDGLWHWDLTSNQVYLSDRWKAMLGFDPDELASTAQSWLGRIHPDDLPYVAEQLKLHADNQTPHFEAEYRIMEQGGTYRWMFARGIAARDGHGRAIRIGGSQTDINERKLAVEELLRTAFYDSLTNLPNRALFIDRLHHAARRSKRRGGPQFAVLFIDLDRFKNVNDTLGHGAGDQLLLEVSRRLENCLRPGDTVARFDHTVARIGGDEFTILIEDIEDAAESIRIAERLTAALSAPYFIAGQEIVTTASIGVAVSSLGFDTPEDLLRDADIAMYRAKKQGKAGYSLCDGEMQAHSLAALHLEKDIRAAVAADEFQLAYQPIVDLKKGAIIGFESLLRWEHPTLGPVPPDEIIPIAESTGLIHPLTVVLMRRACFQLAAWQKAFPQNPPLMMSVNISAYSLSHGGFVEDVARIISDTGIAPGSLKLEITESAVVENLDAAALVMEQLRAMNVSFSVDDFGTGYSSFTYLQRFPIDTLKIDRSFVSGMEDGRENVRIVEMIVPLAQILGMCAVAEGVETPGQLHRLRELGCPYGQGYLFSRPVPAAEATILLQRDMRW